MGTLRSPNSWIPYMNSTDCSQGFCSYYCPQWCYITFPPPPPSRLLNDSSGSHFSPLIIAILGIFASAFLLVSYYTLLSKYCRNTEPSTGEGVQRNSEIEGSRNSSLVHEPWHDSSAGLDEALIKSITVCKFKKGDGLVEGTCSVCLNDFQEDENIRLLPMCTHPFHIPCIDTWLTSHSNCPLCRSSIVPVHSSSIEVFPSVTRSILPRIEALTGIYHVKECVSAAAHIERGSPEEGNNVPLTTLSASSDLGSLQGTDTIIDIEDNICPRIQRSVSMDRSFETRLSIADILQLNQDHRQLPGSSRSLEQPIERKQELSHKKSSMQHLTSPVAMKRSFSSGKFLETRQGRLRSAIIFL